uniref:Lysine demethylase 2A n=1 Tax=Poecilia formosa TaxID=48698 RepID=A0A096M6W0_POEFO
MCWYVVERYLFCLTNISHLTPEFQKYSLGIGLTRADVGSNDPPINGTNGVDGEDEEKPKVEEIKEEEGDEELENKIGTTRPVLTPFELEGLWNLLGKLEELPAHKKCVPAGIRNAAALLEDMRAVLRERAGDDIKLSCTGEPIVKWPERPSWYQPPTPPAPVIYRPRLGPSLHKSKRSTKHTSISALRRRRVRCKRCSACCRKECGDCQYCHDMRKFGGPGRMKKSCVMRQCLMPALPNTARCAVCGEGEFDESDPSTYSLMECTACSQIVHRQCVKEPGEGKINKDLPSCWECPRCYQGNDSDSESKRSYQDDVCEEGPSRGKRSRLHGRQTAPPPSQKLLLQHQQSRKRESALEHRLKKRIKMERSKLLRKVKSSSNINRLSQGQIRGSGWATGSSHSSILGGNGSFGQQKSSHGLVLHPKGEPRRGHGRGVRLRGGGAGRGIRGGGRHHKPEEDSERGSGLNNGRVGDKENRPQSRRGQPATEQDECGSGLGNQNGGEKDDEEEETEEDTVEEERDAASEVEGDTTSRRRTEEDLNNGRVGDKENRPQSRRGQPATEQDECGSGLGNQNGGEKDDEEEETEYDIPKGDKDGSFIKVTLQKPPRAKQDSSAIVPKLEAVAPQTAASAATNQSKALHRPPIRNRGPCPDRNTNRVTPPRTRSRHTDSHSSNPDRLEASKQTRSTRPAKLSNGASSSSSTELHHLRVPLSALQEGGGDADRESCGGGPTCEREVWVSVFRYLNRTDLCVCMAVCKNWYKWCLDKRLWARIDLSIKRTVTPQALTGIIKRQPVTLDLSWTNISKKQLNWLIGRLPGLKDLMLSGCSWSSISALCSTGCPLLRSLDLRNAYGVKDAQIRELVIPPGCDNRSQLRSMQCLRLAGLDISDPTLRLVIRHMPHLTKLDLSHCNSLTDHSINLLTAVGSSTRNTLTELNLGGCSKLTDACLKYLRRLSCISLLDLRGCKGVSRKACEAFISELSVNTLYCLSDEKLIQRIS